MGYVYLIEDKTNIVYKIGVTRSNNKRRLQRLQTGNSTPLTIKYLYQTDYPFRLETILHAKFKEYCVLNEWFELPKNIVDKFEDICNEINNNIIALKDNPFFSKNLK